MTEEVPNLPKLTRDQLFDKILEEGKQAVAEVEKLRRLISELLPMIKEVKDDSVFHQWKINAGLFEPLQMEVGQYYWVKQVTMDSETEWELGFCRAMLDDIVFVYVYRPTNTELFVSKMNGLEYKIRRLEKPE